MSPKSNKLAAAKVNPKTRNCHTKAQLAEDLEKAGESVKGKPLPSPVKQSQLAAKAQGQSVLEDNSNIKPIKCKDSPALDHVDYQKILSYH
ncbi:hypothetical protein DFH28DRAFT_1117614 [Melampsora americana]|nr:hypothetical protein DFH28DRAFT_1117614 [Melampsora americana]